MPNYHMTLTLSTGAHHEHERTLEKMRNRLAPRTYRAVQGLLDNAQGNALDSMKDTVRESDWGGTVGELVFAYFYDATLDTYIDATEDYIDDWEAPGLADRVRKALRKIRQ